jgi:hypothetical protein
MNAKGQHCNAIKGLAESFGYGPNVKDPSCKGSCDERCG